MASLIKNKVSLEIRKLSKRLFPNVPMTQVLRLLLSIVWLIFYNVAFLIICVVYKTKGIGIAKGSQGTAQDVKYVLQWTNPTNSPFEFLEERDEAFVRNECKFRNCYVTHDKHYFLTVEDFDAIIFNGVDVAYLKRGALPKVRSPKQKYIFGAMESADVFPVCYEHFDGFFNWTWTYRLDSDFRWGYLDIYDTNGRSVGPSVHMQWVGDMDRLDDRSKLKLSNKSKAAAWFVSNCRTKRRRERFVGRLRKELTKFGLAIDVFGKCGTRVCPKGMGSKCGKLLKERYFFYLAFENSFARDYVTEKLVKALNNYAVPVVYGGANYSRFIPEGAYLDARKLGPVRLASEMNQLIRNRTAYYDFFRWRNHYVYRGRGRGDVCELCAMLNDRRKMADTTVWNNFTYWWNERNACGY